ncbi:MAG: MFS transporter [Geobacteraceae bacterium]|nr:MFS transporter [Geobacteraceae bacterium]
MQFIPALLLALYVGHAADHHNRRNIVVLAQSVEAVVLLALALFSYLHLADNGVILLITFLLGAARSFEYTTFQTLLPALVLQEALPAAIAKKMPRYARLP